MCTILAVHALFCRLVSAGRGRWQGPGFLFRRHVVLGFILDLFLEILGNFLGFLHCIFGGFLGGIDGVLDFFLGLVGDFLGDFLGFIDGVLGGGFRILCGFLRCL